MSTSNPLEQAAATARLLKTLVQKLPPLVPLALPDDKIAQVFKNIPETDDEDGKWRVFNRRMDVLLDDVRIANERLLHVRRGQYGMDAVVEYIQRCVDNDSLQWEAAEPKFAHLIAELQKQQ
ncbi:hypothetical protein BDP27DRAFT_1369042 [Rhodocollybia butyracea]|uniref:Uncharacterized protein n=1 Tax=Rhodocollybia butyracea TaxID=206335 RepID=A0A9P5PF84_9AGAR|nr:hypothetical protein BDP27DRAFT_1369042 [Rhodocollybia butyracea]